MLNFRGVVINATDDRSFLIVKKIFRARKQVPHELMIVVFFDFDIILLMEEILHQVIGSLSNYLRRVF